MKFIATIVLITLTITACGSMKLPKKQYKGGPFCESHDYSDYRYCVELADRLVSQLSAEMGNSNFDPAQLYTNKKLKTHMTELIGCQKFWENEDKIKWCSRYKRRGRP